MISAVAVPRSRPRANYLRSALLMVVVASFGLLALGASCAGDAPIDRLTIVNRTEFDVEVQASDVKKESWQILGRATHESSTVNELVTDEGATWVFQFHYGGKLVGELTVKSEELVRNKWRVDVPIAVARTMRRLGFEPPPR